jgi:hypothetical protein
VRGIVASDAFRKREAQGGVAAGLTQASLR